ncbi:MAG TPA: hypothetical protein VJ323_06570, partial [Bryobacteraceae bacterium]|nr:hypothetical protein [Bryobacteraceae bacterium]
CRPWGRIAAPRAAWKRSPIALGAEPKGKTSPNTRDLTGMCGPQITLANSVHSRVTAQLQLNQRIN